MAHKHLLHLKSSRVNTEMVNGVEVNTPSLPAANLLENGEIAINYAKDYERLSIKNSNDEIVTFLPDHVILDYQQATSESLSSLDERVTEVEGLADDLQQLSEDFTDYKEEANGKFDNLNGTIENLTQEILDNEETVASALNDLNSRIDNIDIPDVSDELERLAEEINTINNVTIPDVQHEVDENQRQINLLGTSLAQTNQSLANVMETVGDGDFYDSPNDLLHRVAALEEKADDIDELKNELISDEKVISSALNDLNERIGEANGSLADDIEELKIAVDELGDEVVDKFNEAKEDATNKVNELSEIVNENEIVTSSALNDLNSRITELVEQIAQLSQLLNSKADSSDLSSIWDAINSKADSSTLTTLSETVDNNELTVSSALNDLNARLLPFE